MGTELKFPKFTHDAASLNTQDRAARFRREFRNGGGRRRGRTGERAGPATTEIWGSARDTCVGIRF